MLTVDCCKSFDQLKMLEEQIGEVKVDVGREQLL